jgi:8-oxo-dGTP diphosphatase
MVLLIKDNKALFLVRKKENEDIHKEGVFLPIGGKVEKGESLEECAVRETEEESGIKINKLTLKGVLYTRTQKDGELNDWINYLFFSYDFKGNPVDGNEGTFEWVDLKNMSKINMYDGERKFLETAFKRDFHVMESLHRGYELVSYKILTSI